MKFTLSLAVLALAASQVMAVVPKPIASCTKTVVVQPTDTGCDAFAAANGCTFADMLKWNEKLSPKCDNLDVGHPICVSVTPGAGAGDKTTTAPGATTTVAATSSVPAGATTTGATTAVQTTTAAAVPTTNSTTTATPKVTQPVSGANGNKASIVLGAAGVLLSAIYML
ncbi:hypothetical protein BGZ76_000409 [Entomortierella beljakovae]|nr:hypothetical protein BGZ76_000409 [Entomortierella beljakovae]